MDRYRALLQISICAMFVAVSLSGQTTDPAARLSPALSKALASAGAANELTAAMMALAVPARHISQDEVNRLANALSGVTAGRKVSDTQAVVLSRCVIGLMQARGTSNFALAARFRDALAALRIGDTRTDLIVRRFVAVAGPDDFPAQIE